MPYFEDMNIGDRRELGSFTFTPEGIKAFAAKFDPQPFHLDEEAGRNSVFGGLAASGWHVAATYMRLTVARFPREAPG
ncbi:MAG TPA: dehydratase, partial [Afipia sp.]|nr:dehydratase [Afipia sp.]